MTVGPFSSAASLTLGSEHQPAVNLLVNAVIERNGVPAAIDAVEQTISVMRPSIELLWPAALDPEVYERISQQAMLQILVDIAPPVYLATDFKPWFEDAVVSGAVILERWYSYKQFLTTAKGFAPQVLSSLDSASTAIVDLVGDPRETGSWKRRGLVIGDVQSGKTATYIGIVNKAADAGFKIVVLLTGGTESLRRQTQYRVDEGLLGKDSTVVAHDKVIGVGDFPTRSKFLRGQGMTTQAKDFVGSSLAGQAVHIDPNADHPYVFVIKKNKTPLTNLITWLSTQFKGGQFDIPMLVVDDESDYASVNTNYKTSGDTNPTLINQKIRELLALTARSSYMAFTATPFANVFIDHTSFDEALKDDLFPHDYIFALASPSNYVGAKKYFGTSGATVSTGLVDITDAHEIFPPKHKSQLVVPELPSSLVDAIKAFVVASAIRLARGDHGARSMLVNVSRFKHVQAQVYDLVGREFGRIKTAIEVHGQPPVQSDAHQVIQDLSDSYKTYFGDSQITWPEVRDKLFAGVFSTTVELVNSSREKDGDDTARNMIAVGGDVLSRGLTLEGLTVSYFYRLVGSADTLLQMARWFGYRPGYEDLVRVWIGSDVADQFRFVSDVTSELREQVREMRELNKTPKDFGLMIRKHPESLAITAKKGVAETHLMVISLSGRRIETTRIPAANSVLLANDKAVRTFLRVISEDDPDGGWNSPELRFPGKVNVDKGRVADLLQAFRYDRGNLILANALHKIIRDKTAPAFSNWTVGIVGGQGPRLELAPNLTVATPERSVRYSPDGPSGTFRISGKSARLAGSTDLARTYSHHGDDLQEPAVYKALPHPTLLIYPLRPKFEVPLSGEGQHAQELTAHETASAEAAWSKASADGALDCLMALKIAIPGEPGSEGGDVEYLLNGPAIEEFVQEFNVSVEDEADMDE